MARVNTAVAAKDYPHKGIKKGDTYFYWQLYKQPKQMSLTRPRASQLTGSDKLSRVYAAGEDLEDVVGEADSLESIVEALNTAAEAVREVAEEYGESADNMEQAFPNGSPTIDMCRENQDSLAAYADELESAASDVEGLDVSDFVDEDERRAAAIAALEELHEGDEPFDPSEEEIEEWLDANPVKEFEDLSETEQEAMLSDARDLAAGPSCPV